LTKSDRIFALEVAIELCRVDRDAAVSGKDTAKQVIDHLETILAEAYALPDELTTSLVSEAPASAVDIVSKPEVRRAGPALLDDSAPVTITMQQTSLADLPRKPNGKIDWNAPPPPDYNPGPDVLAEYKKDHTNADGLLEVRIP
jgi:hypothetical protein